MVLVSILGDFHSSIFPVFFEFKDKIDKHIILFDDSKYDQKQFNNILKGQQYFLSNYENIEKSIFKLNYEIISMKIDEDSYEDILECYESIINHANNSNEIYLNTTDGLSSISMVLSNKLLEHGANVFSYDRYANTYNLHTKNSIDKYKINENIDIKNHLKLKGYNLLKYTDKFTLKNRKSTIQKLTRSLTEYKQFAKSYPYHLIEYNFYQSLIDQLDIEENRKKFFIDGVVFEEYIYWLIKDNFDFDDIMTGVCIEFDDGFVNEIDILMIKDNHLHALECKFTSNFKGSEYIYKMDSIMDCLDDDGKGMILTVGNKDHFTNGDKSRAKNNQILLYAADHFNEENFLKSIKEFF